MQPGVLRRSQLLESLKEYLNNKGRLQPIIGLGSLTECVRAGAQCGEVLYLCGVCVCRHSKADVRNHILGSLHRFNYIKTWHPHLLSKWQESSDLSKLAWPLMEIAKKLEEQEGTGEIQLLEVEDDVYQRMATSSENDAVALIRFLRNRQDGTETRALHYPTESQRTVVLARDQSRCSQKSLKADANSYKISAHANRTQPLPMHANADPSASSEACLVNTFTAQLDAPEPSVLSEINGSFPDDYTGTLPLIGLSCVVECRSEDGSSYCWLCHCCRIRSNKKDMIDHLTSSSHLLNYLMEAHPEEVEEVTADVKGKSQLLQSLGKKVEQEKGRGELKVVHVPETLCTLLTGKSYHWCIKMLYGEWKPADIQKKETTVNGPSVNQAEKCALMKPKSKKRAKGKWKTVFNVSMPLTKGLVLLKRTSFNRDRLPASPPSHSDLTPHPGSEVAGCELECDGLSFEFNQADAGMYTEGNFTGTQCENKDTGTLCTKCKNEETQNEAPLAAVSSHSSSYRDGEGWTEQGHSSDAGQYYYQQHFQNPHTPCDDRSLQTGGVGGHRDACGDVAPHVNGSRVNMLTHSVDVNAYCSGIPPYSNLTGACAWEAPQNWGPQPAAYGAGYGYHGWMSYPSFSTAPRMIPDQQFLPPVCSSGNGWSVTHSIAFSQPYEPQCAGSHANFYFS